MFEHNISPVLFEIGKIQIRYYGLVYAIGFLAGLMVLLNASKKKLIKNLDEDKAYDLILVLIISSILSARLFFELVYNLKDFMQDPFQYFYFWNGGMSVHGGLIGACFGVLIYCKRKKINFYDIADTLVVPFALILGFGRIANFINGELYGRVTNVWWCVDFGDGKCRHPSQLYESAKNFLIFGILFWVKSFKNLKRGTLFWSFIFLYGLLRFLVTFYREAEYYFFGIGIGQLISISMVPIAGVMIFRLYKK